MSRLTSGSQLTDLVLPSHPGVGFPAHDRRVNGLAEGEPLIPIPLPGRRGAESLYDDRLAAPELVAGLRTLIAERWADPFLPSHRGAAVLFGGVAFPAERGGELVNRGVAFPRSQMSARQSAIAGRSRRARTSPAEQGV